MAAGRGTLEDPAMHWALGTSKRLRSPRGKRPRSKRGKRPRSPRFTWAQQQHLLLGYMDVHEVWAMNRCGIADAVL